MAAESEVEDQFRFSCSFSVQELVKEPVKTIPQQYVRLDDWQPVSSAVGARPTQMLPIIDMKELLSGKDSDLELQKLDSTCKEWGFFQLVNHGVDSLILEKLNQEVEGFYKLPLEEKMKFKIREGDVEGYGPIEREGGKYDWADRFSMMINPKHKRLPHLFPELPSSLRNVLESYILAVQNLGSKLLSLMAKALKIDEKEMRKYCDDGLQSLRMAYYPPCPQPELVMGIAPHSDSTLITILHQLSGVDGLYIHKDGVWIPVSFLPNALAVNVGDILEHCRSLAMEFTVALSTRCYQIQRERLTVVIFMNPKIEAAVGPSPSLIDARNPPLFKSVSQDQYIKGFFSRQLNGKSYLQYMRIDDDGEDN